MPVLHVFQTKVKILCRLCTNLLGIFKPPLQFIEEDPINHFSVVQLLIYKYYYVLWSVKNAKKESTLSLADPGKARGCSTNTSVNHSFID